TMGLFDEVGAREPRLTPALALGSALVFVASAGGVLDEDAFALVARRLETESRFEEAVRYASRHSFEAFVTGANEILNQDQRFCIFLNAVDVGLRHGRIGPAREARLVRMMEVFGISEDEVRGAVATLATKN